MGRDRKTAFPAQILLRFRSQVLAYSGNRRINALLKNFKLFKFMKRACCYQTQNNNS